MFVLSELSNDYFFSVMLTQLFLYACNFTVVPVILQLFGINWMKFSEHWQYKPLFCRAYFSRIEGLIVSC